MDFNVKNDYEFVGNYKELQQALTKTGVKKVRLHQERRLALRVHEASTAAGS